MIKLEKNFWPLCLRPAEEVRLAHVYAATGNSVWGDKEIVEALKMTSNSKCAYCEARLGIESHYLEVDHFEHKDKYKDKVANWSNLVPSCRRCNGTKREHDVRAEPIVNPYQDEPRDHLAIRNYRFRAKTKLGETSIEVLDLNNSDRAVKARFEIGEQVHESLITCLERLESFKESRTTRRRNLLLSVVRSLLLECQPTASYAATTATVLHKEPAYETLVSGLKNENLWDRELDAMHLSSLALILSDVA